MSKRKLLLADDSVTIQKVVNLTFADEGIDVISVGDGDSAMNKFVDLSPDLVMADVNMPGLNGYQLCEKIRQESSKNQTPVILLVGSFEPFDEEEAKRVGADDYLTKPFQSIRQLVNKVTVLLNSSNTLESEIEQTTDNSFVDTLKMQSASDNEVQETNFADTGFDDEMIQTSQANPVIYDEFSKYETKKEIQIQADSDYYQTTNDTEQNKADSLSEINFVSDATNDDSEENIDQLSDDLKNNSDYQDAKREIEIQSSNQELQETSENENYNEEIPDSENILVESPIENTDSQEIDSKSEMDETQNVEQDESSHKETENTSRFVENPENNLREENKVETEEEMPLPEVASILQIDESNPLELPPIETDAESREDSEVKFSENQQEKIEHGINTTSFLANESAGLKDNENSEINSELIDLIVNEIMQRLSEKVVREIAWEVVPQHADLIIKKMVEEKLKES